MNIVPRAAWGARFGQGHATAGAKLEYYVHHSAARQLTPASSAAQEAAEVRRIEAYHASDLTRANPRIGYTHLIAPTGRVYEGTDWGRIGAHTGGKNSSSYGVCIMDDGERNEPSAAVVMALGELRIIGIRAGHLHANHRLLGHRDSKATACPGDRIYDVTVAIAKGGGPRPTPADVMNAMPTLRRGSTGAAVRELQGILVELRLMTAAVVATGPGVFGPATEAAVREFQSMHRLDLDGVVGHETWAALRKAVG